MGNTTSAGPQQQHHQGHHQQPSKPVRQEPKRRESVNALPPTTPKAAAAPPSASLESAVGQSALTSISPSQPRDVVKPTRSRDRSASSAASHNKPREVLDATMGNDPSKPFREQSRSTSSSKPSQPRTPTSLKTTSPTTDKRQVSGVQQEDENLFDASPIESSAPPPDPYNLASASYVRPPRLPLAIDEELHTPGSPILSAVEPATDVPPVDVSNTQELNRRASVISSNVDEEEEKDEFQSYMPDVGPNLPKVPTVIEWRDARPTDRVYVTGTFADWERKYRLHWNGPSKHANTLSATLQLPPGTHHVKFLVNNDMQVASHLPTTVDYTNILVNYIEVASNKVVSSNAAAVAVPAPVPTKPLDIRPKQTTETPPSNRRVSASTNRAATSSPHHTPSKSSPRTPGQQKATPSTARSREEAKKIEEKTEPPKFYTNEIPAYLLDLDIWPPPSETDSSPDAQSVTSRYRRANKVALTQPEPPSLPLFLNKSILNQNTPMKDDSSVLILPNHTVLNHLSTTNIKNGILATSCTSRYKQRNATAGEGTDSDGGKFLTTILYKPRSDDD